MQRLAIIGDPHFANKKLFGVPTHKPGVNGRLQNVLDVFEWILEDLPEDVDQVCILGDITHDHGHLTPPVLNAVRELFEEYNAANKYVTLLSGNHDIDANGSSIITAFENFNTFEVPGVEVVTDPRQIFWSYSVPIYAIPYCSHDETVAAFKKIEEDYKRLKVKPVVLMHHHFDGAVHGAHEYEPAGGISPKEIPECVRKVISGHYHTAQEINERIEYVGTPAQNDFGEAPNVPTYWIVNFYDDENIEIEKIPIRVGNRFHILPHNIDVQDVPGDQWRDYYRIDLPTDVESAVIEPLIDALSHVIVKPIPVEVELRSRVGEALEDDTEDAGGKVTVQDAVKAYAILNAEPERVDPLVELADKIIKASEA